MELQQKLKGLVSAIGMMVLISGFIAADQGTAKSRTYGYLGVGIEKLTQTDKEDLNVDWGVLVTEVVRNSPAEKAGIQEDDVIQYYKGSKVESTSALVNLVRETPAGEKILVTLIRGEKEKDVYAVIAQKRERRSRSAHWYGNDGGHFEFDTDRAYLGVQLHDVDEDLASYFKVKPDEGALVLKLMEDSPAEKAGLKSGDFIIQIDDEKIRNASEVSEFIGDKEADEEIKIVVLRHRKKMTLTAQLDANKRMKRIMIRTGSDWDEEKIVVPEIHMDMDMHREKLIEYEKNMKEYEDRLKNFKDEMKVRKIVLPGRFII